MSGSKPKPEIVEGDAKLKDDFVKWIEMDKKAKTDNTVYVCPSELKQIKNCETSSDILKKLEEIYQSEGSDLKASLLKFLFQIKMLDFYADNCV